MEDGRERDIRVPLISFLFCLSVLAGGFFLAVYVFVPSLSEPWFPVAAFLLIGSPWIFWFLTYIYTCVKACLRTTDGRDISRRSATMSHPGMGRNPSSLGGSNANSSQSNGGGEGSSMGSNKESEMPLTYAV